MDNKKKIILNVLVVLLLLVVGVTYAFFTYESGTKSDIVTGQIYMNYEETSTITLTGVFPETKEQALARQDENGVFEFTITGRNTSKYPVYYEIDLLEGGVMTGKTEQSTKILPEHVRIYLERDGEPLVDGMTFKYWNNRRIYVDTVPAGTTSNIEHKYTLRMWIDENVTISDTDPNADYTTTEWNDAYASLKVRVVGDFEYKEVATDASCFAYNVIDAGITYDYPIITLDTSDEKVDACKTEVTKTVGKDISDAQDGYQSFCEGTGTAKLLGAVSMTLKENVTALVLEGAPEEDLISWFPVVSDITTETRYYELNTSEESVNACKEYLLNGGEDYSDAQDGYQSFCEGVGTVGGQTIHEESSVYYGLTERNVFTQVEELPQAIQITGYDTNCGTDVIIPSQIEGLPVTKIAGQDELTEIYGYSQDYGAFGDSGITSVKFPNTLKYIGNAAFGDNELTNVVIPDSVTYIGRAAFSSNLITNIEIGTGVTNIVELAFYENPLVTVNVKGNPILGRYSFGASYQDDINKFQTFQYGGTCEEMYQYARAFGDYTAPLTIITIDNNACDIYA